MSGFRFLTNARTSFTAFAPVMFGTRRMDTLSSARGGTMVLTPGPVYPPTRPWTSKVGKAHSRMRASSGSLVRTDRKS